MPEKGQAMHNNSQEVLWSLSKVTGHLDEFSETMDLAAEPAIELTIAADRLDSGNARRDKHLRSKDFFEVEKFRKIRFLADSASLDGERLDVRGRLHAVGKSVPLELEATVKQIGDEVEVVARAEVDQRQPGMTFVPMRTIGTPTKVLVEGRLV